MRRLVFVTVMMLFTGMLVWGCGPSSCREDGRVFRPVDEKAAVFWDRQTTESAELLRGMAETFNSEWQGLPIKVERSGNYADIFRKITAGIHAKRLPAMAVS